MLLAVMPFPSPDMMPPVTTTYCAEGQVKAQLSACLKRKVPGGPHGGSAQKSAPENCVCVRHAKCRVASAPQAAAALMRRSCTDRAASRVSNRPNCPGHTCGSLYHGTSHLPRSWSARQISFPWPLSLAARHAHGCYSHARLCCRAPAGRRVSSSPIQAQHARRPRAPARSAARSQAGAPGRRLTFIFDARHGRFEPKSGPLGASRLLIARPVRAAYEPLRGRLGSALRHSSLAGRASCKPAAGDRPCEHSTGGNVERRTGRGVGRPRHQAPLQGGSPATHVPSPGREIADATLATRARAAHAPPTARAARAAPVSPPCGPACPAHLCLLLSCSWNHSEPLDSRQTGIRAPYPEVAPFFFTRPTSCGGSVGD